MTAVKSALRALLIIELLTDERQGLTFAAIGQRLGLPKSSVHGLLTTMVERGHLQLDPATRHYRLGIRIWEAGQAYARSFDLPSLARPFMEAARDALNETVQLAVLDGLENIYVAKVEADQRLVLASHVGGRLPAYATGLGKVLLAGLPDDELDRRLDGVTLERFTDATTTDPDELRALLAEVRARGFAQDVGEYTAGVSCIAVPVHDHRGAVIAAMSVSVPHVRFGLESRERMIAVLPEQARGLSRALGFDSRTPPS